jgi:hypothetical protein
MPALLLALHLWNVPLAPTYVARLHLLPTRVLLPSILRAEAPESASAALPAWTPLQYTLAETAGGVAAFLAVEAVVAGLESALVLGVDAVGASSGNPLGPTLITLGAIIAVVDFFGFPMLMAVGAQVAAQRLGFAELNWRTAVGGAYLGAAAGTVLLLFGLLVEAAAAPSTNHTTSSSGIGSISPLAWSAMVGGLVVPILGGLGASIGQHLSAGPVDGPAPSAPVLDAPPPLPPDQQPPPHAAAPPARGLPFTVTLLQLHFG